MVRMCDVHRWLFRRHAKPTSITHARLSLAPLEDRTVPTSVVTVEAFTNAFEGGAAGAFRITRDGDTSQSLNVFVGVSGSSTATPGQDFSFIGSQVTFAANSATADVAVNPIDDSAAEPLETVVLNIFAGSGYTVGNPSSATVYIHDNDTPVISVERVSNATEGAANGLFRLTRTGGTGQVLTVSYTIDGTATPGADFALLSGQATFAVGSATADVAVAPVDDGVAEYDETVYLTVTDGTGYTVESLGTAGLLILDNETPVVSIEYFYDALEGGWKGVLGVKRTGNTSQPLTVQYTVGGTATSGTDYTAPGGSVTFQAGEVFTVIEVQALTDAIADPNETVAVTLQAGSGYTTDPTLYSADLTIDEDASVVQIESSPTSVAEGASGTIVLRRTGGDLTTELTVAVRISGEGATPASWVYDYVVNGRLSLWSDWGQVTFAPNQATVTLTIQAREDDVSEGNEQFLVELGAGDGTTYVLHQIHSASVVITNVVPSGTVPILAEEDKPLNSANIIALKGYLQLVGAGKKLTPAQEAEMKWFLKRLGKYGIEAEGQQRLQQLSGLLDALGSVVKRPGAVGTALQFYKEGVDGIIGGLKVVRENEYKKFKQQMGDKTGKLATERYNEIKDGFVAEWVEYHWLRYQAEKIQEKLNSM